MPILTLIKALECQINNGNLSAALAQRLAYLREILRQREEDAVAFLLLESLA